MDTVKLDIKSDEEANRIELFIRMVWGCICGIVLYVLMLVAYVVFVVQWLHILILGKRNMGMTKYTNAVLKAQIGLFAYVLLSTEERPPIVPPLS